MNRNFFSFKKKAVSAVTALLFASASLVSCTAGSTDGPMSDASSAAPEQTEHEDTEHESVIIHAGDPDAPVWAEAYLRSLPDKNYDGATFFIASTDNTLFATEENVYLSDTVYARNRAVEEKYNISVATEKTDSVSMIEEITNANLAGLSYANICCIPMGDVGSFAAGGHLMNLRSLPALDTSAEYFNSSSVMALSAGYKTYGIAGEALPAAFDVSAVFFNRNLLREVGGEEAERNIFASAEAGTFTWDEFYKYAALAFGHEGIAACASLGGTTAEAVHVSVGGMITNSGEMKVPTVAFTADGLTGAITHMRTIREIAATAGINDNASTAFSEGKLLFTIGTLRDIQSLSSEQLAFSILPMPKAAADGKVRSLVGKNALVMTVPEGSADAEMVSLVLSALNAASYGYITEKYVDHLHLTVLSDNRSADMLELIADSAVYDLSTAFSETHPDIASGTLGLIRQVSELLDYSGYDSLVSAAEYDMAVSFPCSN